MQLEARIPPRPALEAGVIHLGIHRGTYIHEMLALIPCKYGVKEILEQRGALSGLLPPAPLADGHSFEPPCSDQGDATRLTVSSYIRDPQR
jgi:hypothetical protein